MAGTRSIPHSHCLSTDSTHEKSPRHLTTVMDVMHHVCRPNVERETLLTLSGSSLACGWKGKG